MLPHSLKTETEKTLTRYTGKKIEIENITVMHGGSINHALKLSAGGMSFFLKWNNTAASSLMFEAESRGIKLLRNSLSLNVPEVIATGTAGEHAYLLLEFIQPGIPSETFWEDFAVSLAGLHRHTAISFGLDHDNYIGSLPQHNTRHDSWVDFFAEERLEIQLRMAVDKGKIASSLARHFGTLFQKLHALIPAEEPSLIHGDLWNGNVIVSPSGQGCLIDPAVYYGSREMDIAMSRLFGGFPREFYDHYNRCFPLLPCWEERMDICNLYPLLVHVNLFGGGYLQEIKNILKRF